VSARRPDARALGILGGTFNPPHLGHVAVASHAREELALERVLLVPADTAPHKSNAEGGADPGPEHRLRMCQLAIEGVEGLAVCAIELERGGLSYTVDTLRSIHAEHPDAELTLIVGADIATTLSSWREPGQLLELAQLAVAARAGAARQRVLDTLVAVKGHADVAKAPQGMRSVAESQVRFLDMPTISVSSSLVRERVGRKEPVEKLVGPAVARYIDAHGLYRAGSEVAA
jgi:nicotinate-nucleotide adenylyltransferase